MKRLHETKIDDAKYYERIWDEDTNERPFYDAVRIRALVDVVLPGDRVLDVGAGVYGGCQYIAEEMPNLAAKVKLSAIDQSYTARDIVKGKHPYIDYRLGDVTKLPYEDGSFDVVIAGEIIEHMEDPQAFVFELARVTAWPGCITLTTVDTKCDNAIAHGEYPEHLWEFEPEDLLKFFENAGAPAQHEYVGDYHFIIAWRS